jgi:hypothetical protein
VDSLVAFASSLAADAQAVRPGGTVMAPLERKRGQALLFFGMVACAASLIIRRFDLDFLSGVALGISLAFFFLGFRAFYRK